MACSGDVPTLEALAAVCLLRARLARSAHPRGPTVVVDLMALQPQSEHPHGCRTRSTTNCFPPARRSSSAFHGYPWLIHRLTYRRHNHDNTSTCAAYKEEGTTTTPFDMCVLNNIDRFQLGARRHPARAEAGAEDR